MHASNTYHTHKYGVFKSWSQVPSYTLCVPRSGLCTFPLPFQWCYRKQKSIKKYSHLRRAKCFSLLSSTYQASLTFLVSGQAQQGFRGFFSAPSRAAGSALAADTVGIFWLNWRNYIINFNNFSIRAPEAPEDLLLSNHRCFQLSHWTGTCHGGNAQVQTLKWFHVVA